MERERVSLVYSRSEQSWLVEETNHYYPYGTMFGESTGLANSTQPYKYTGKELDRMHGLDLHDHGARWSDTNLARWPVIDPRAEKFYGTSPYVLCADNPICLIDLNGKEPGDAFSSSDEAALNFGLIYNYYSIINGVEYAGFIYRYTDTEGKEVYSYAASGAQGESSAKAFQVDDSTIPSDIEYTIVATIHTHGADDSYSQNPHLGNKFSEADKSSDVIYHSYDNNITAGYLCTTNGSLMKNWYDKANNCWKTIVFHGERYMLPSDANDVSHNKYTAQMIKTKYYNQNIFKQLWISRNKYLERRLYR